MIDKKKLLIIIPAYNEQDNILLTIKELKQSSAKDLDYIVINDGSKDDTLQVLQDNQINHLSYEQNGGLSHAVRVGMTYALEHGYDYCIQIDADNQHDPAYINDFVNAANNPNCIIVGNRYQNNKRGMSLKALAQ
ncbi:glycosyltransferase family 2 protein [bacterium]|nr:glycosyltransferase family 2 protein [bacterium]